MTEAVEELIAKLEQLGGASREVDGLIFKAVTEKPGDHWHQFEDGDDVGEESLSPVWYRRDPEDESAYEAPPFYSESIDAALTLAKNPLLVLLMAVSDCIGVRFIKKDYGGSDGLQFLINRICVHALRARAAQAEGE